MIPTEKLEKRRVNIEASASASLMFAAIHNTLIRPAAQKEIKTIKALNP